MSASRNSTPVFRILALLGLVFAVQGAQAADISVQLPWKHQFETAPFVVAIEKGYYQEAQLKVTLKEWAPGVQPVDEVVSGKSAFGMYPSALIIERAKGKPVVAIAAFLQHSPVALLAKRSSNIRSVLDLHGKRIAFSHDTEDEILAYLSSNGIQKDSFTSMERAGLGIEMLTQNKADAIGMYSTNESFLTVGHEDEYVMFLPSAAGIDLFGTILYTSEQYLHDNPERVAVSCSHS